MIKSSKHDLLNSPIKKTVNRMAIPMLFSFSFNIIYNLSDTFFVSKLGEKPLAAMSFTFPIVMSVFSILMGISSGTSSIISRSTGKNIKQDPSITKKISGDILIFSLITAFFMAIIGLLSEKYVFSFMGAKGETLILIHEYMKFWYLSLPFFILLFIGNTIMRSLGDAKTPAIIMFTGIMGNIILDPIFIFGFWFIPKMGIAGASLATLTSRILTNFLAFYILFKKKKALSSNIRNIKKMIESWKELLYISIPATASNLLNPISGFIITKIIASHSEIAVAAYGVGGRIDGLAMIPAVALNSALVPIIGQNMGAKQYQRIMGAIKYAMKLLFIWAIFASIAIIFFSSNLAQIFNESNEGIKITSLYLKIIPISYFSIFYFAINNYIFYAIKKPYNSLYLIFTKMIILVIPLVYLGSYLDGVRGIFIGLSVSAVIASVISFFKFNKSWKKWREYARENKQNN